MAIAIRMAENHIGRPAGKRHRADADERSRVIGEASGLCPVSRRPEGAKSTEGTAPGPMT